LHNVNAIDNDAAAIWLVECPHYLKECCLSCTACSNDAYHIAPLYVEVDALEYFEIAEALSDITNLYHFEF